MNRIYFIFSLILLLLTTCKSEKSEGTLAIKFEAKVNDTNLAYNKYYLMDGDSVKFEILKFYVSDINIEDKDGTKSVELKDVTIVDFNNESATMINSALATNTYKNLSFNIGLSNEKNEMEPTSFTSEHPLSAQQGNYWMMANSYVFIKIEGKYLSNGVEQSFVYHVGANDYAKTKKLEQALSIHEGNTTTILISLNLNSVFTNVDFVNEPSTHSANSLAEKIRDNFANSLSIN